MYLADPIINLINSCRLCALHVNDSCLEDTMKSKKGKTSNSSLKTRGAAAPRTRITSASFLIKFRRTFAEVITFGEATAHEFQPNFKLSAFEIGHLVIAQYKIII